MVGRAGSGRRKRVRVQGILVGPRTGSKDARAADPGAPPVEAGLLRAPWVTWAVGVAVTP